MRRREFLGSVAGIAATSVVGWKFYDYVKKPVRFVVPSPSKYWHNDNPQKFNNTKIDSNIFITNIQNNTNGSLISIAEEGTKRIKKISIDDAMHSTFVSGNLLYCISVGSAICSINLDSLKLEKAATAPAGWAFGGHASQIPGTRLLLVSMLQQQMGIYDRISVFDMDTLREIHHLSTYGFGAHELHALPNGHVLVGHYGSVPGSGAYSAFASTAKMGEKPSFANTKDDKRGSYPPCISIIELSTGKLIDRKTHTSNGQHAHFIVSNEEQIFVPKNPMLMESRNDTLTHRAFKEGIRYENDYLNFTPHLVNDGVIVDGLSIIWDKKYKQAIAAGRVISKVFYTSSENFSNIKTIDLNQIDPNCGWANGIDLHPDGVHYVVSTNTGFMTFRLDDHSYVANKSFKADLKVHSHFMIA